MAVGAPLPARGRDHRRRDGPREDGAGVRVSLRFGTQRVVPADAGGVPGDDVKAVAPRAPRVGAAAQRHHPARVRGVIAGARGREREQEERAASAASRLYRRRQGCFVDHLRARAFDA